VGFESQYDNPLSANSSVILDAFQSRGTVGSSVDFFDAYLNGSWNIDFPDWTGCTNAPTELLSQGLLIVTGNDGVVLLDYIDKDGYRAFARGTNDGVFSDWIYYRQEDSDTSEGKVEVPVGFDKGRAKIESVQVYTAEKVDELLAEQPDVYADRKIILAPFNVHTLPIGSYKFTSSNWTGVTNAPSVLPAGGHFQVFTANNSRIVLYTVSVASAVKNACFLTRAARLVITSGVAESWAYFAQGTTQNFSRIKVASEYDSGMATKVEHEVYGADWINQYAFLDRGTRSSKINFNGLIKSGRYRINNAGGWSAFGSLNCPPTTVTTGYLEVSSNGCSVFQKYYPDDAQKIGLLFRERTEAGVWSSWFTASEGNMLVGTDRVKVPTSYRRGIASGYALIEVYSASKVDEKFTYVGGTDISVVGNVISYTGSGGIGSETDPIYTASSWYGTTNNSSNWNSAYSWGNYALRNLTVQGTSGRITSSAGAQSLAADRAWTLDLATVHAGLSGGSTTKTLSSFGVDAYGRTISAVFSDIAFPAETDPTVPSWVKAITSTQISNWDSAYTWGNHAGLYSLLGHSHTWTEISGKPTTFAPSAHTHPYTDITGITAGTGITYVGGVIASTITQYTDAMARASISVTGGASSYNATTGVITVPITSTQIGNWDTAYGWGTHIGLYPPKERVLTIAGTTGRISVSGGAQSLQADRTWTADLVAVHAGLSGGSTTSVPTTFVVDAYGRVTSLSFSAIAFPVTSVNGQTGAVILTTDSISEGTTNKYFSNTLARAAFSAGTGISIASGVISSTITQYTNANAQAAISATAPITYASGVIGWAGTTSDVPEGSRLYYTDARSRAAFSAGTGISYNATTGIISLGAIHAGLSGGSAITTPSIIVNSYGQVSSLIYSTILFPVTSVNGQTGGVVLTTDNITEGTTNKYFSTTLARGAFSAGTGISISAGVISSTITQYTDAMARAAISAGGLLSYNSTTGLMSLSSVPWANLSGVPDLAGTYAPLSRSLTVSGTTSNIVVTGGTQTLAGDRSWTVNLAALHVSPLSGGSGTQVPYFTVDIYGRVTGITNTNITYPVTSVNGQTGAVSLSTTNIAEGTNLYWTNARGDARYSLLGHTHAFSEITSKPTTLSGYGITDAIGGSGTTNTVAKFTGSSTLGNSQLTDDGTTVKIGAPSGIGRLSVAGAVWASSDAGAVSYYAAGGGAFRFFGNGFFDSYEGEMNFRTGASFTYTLNLKSTGQVRFNTYTSSSSWAGTRAGLLGFDSSGHVLTVNASDFAAFVHNHDSSYYTKSQLNTSGGGGVVHWNNLTGVPSLSYAGHTHIIADVSGLQSALDGKPGWGDVYTRTQSDARYLQSYNETDPFGLDSHWFSTSGSTVTLGIQRRNGTQVYSNFNVPGTDWSSITNRESYTMLGYGIDLGGGGHQLKLKRMVNGADASEHPVTFYETDPYGVSWASMSFSGGTIYLTIGLRNGSNVYASQYIGGGS
jgi:hypothetical protein